MTVFLQTLSKKNEEYLSKCNHKAIDKWLIMDMPKEVYYHKHLMYNMGLLQSAGDILVICDSDGIVKPTFLESIWKEFKNSNNLVLHLDQLRNYNRDFYPFNYPRIDQAEKEATNYYCGKPYGLQDERDPLHSKNYGACFCARRKDLIRIGGADEHRDYLGHICGPYEMTWRLVNAGCEEKWHQEEWMLHVWHPGQAGDNNFVGPHDGFMLSTTALEAKTAKRILPLVENEFIQILRNHTNAETFALSFPEMMIKIKMFERVAHWHIHLEDMKVESLRCHSDYEIKVFSEKSKNCNTCSLQKTVRAGVFCISVLYTKINSLLGRSASTCITNDVIKLLDIAHVRKNNKLLVFWNRLYARFLHWTFGSKS